MHASNERGSCGLRSARASAVLLHGDHSQEGDLGDETDRGETSRSSLGGVVVVHTGDDFGGVGKLLIRALTATGR